MAVMVVIFAAPVFMYRLANMCEMSPWKWAIITFFICLGASFLIPWPYINMFIGLVISYGLFAVCKITRKEY